MTQPVKQSTKRASTSPTAMLRMAATARALRVKASDIPPAKEKFVKA